jgi:hypothetical protein
MDDGSAGYRDSAGSGALEYRLTTVMRSGGEATYIYFSCSNLQLLGWPQRGREFCTKVDKATNRLWISIL